MAKKKEVEESKDSSQASSKTESKEEQLQQKYLQFQFLQQQIEQYSQQLEALTQQMADLDLSLEALKQLEKTPQENEVLASIAPGIFFKTILKDNQKLIINVGADVTVEKTIPQVLKLLETQKKGVEKNLAQTDALLQIFTKQALQIYQELG